MITYMIIDDEHIAHDIIKGYCELVPDFQLKQQCYDAIEAIAFLREQQVDLIFLDLNMPKLKGFDFLRTLTNPPKVIVTTAYKEHALEGYELNIIDYLLKPFSFERFLKAVNKAFDQNVQKPPVLTSNTSNTPKSIFLRTNKKYIQLETNKVMYIEASGNYTKIITTTETITIREKISDLIKTLNHSDLIQVHKSFAVAKSYINSIEGNRIFIDEHVIPIGKMYRTSLIRSLG